VSQGYSPLLKQLIGALQCLPGVGTKSAQRMAFHLLHKDREGASHLAVSLEQASRRIRHCELCRMLTEDRLCTLCSSDRRDGSLLCVVEMPADVIAIEQSAAYRGRYFVLMGHMSPLDGVGPQELGLDLLERRLKEEDISEVVLATSVTVEGDATAHLVASLAARHGRKASRIAYGVPMGGELEFIDSGTLSRALSGRREIEGTPMENAP
jgi:recombination protein RecR